MSYLVECDWASSAIFIAITDEEYGLMLYESPKHYDKGQHGFCGKGSIALTKEQAKKLANDLLAAVDQYENTDGFLDRYEQERKSHDS
jgi:hypothetical protein